MSNPGPQLPLLRIGANRERSRAAQGLAVAIMAAALIASGPAVWELVEYARQETTAHAEVPRWTYVALFFSAVQAAYALYLFQLPDWRSVWVVTLQSLTTGGLYALVLGVVISSKSDAWLVGPSGLQLGDKLAGGAAALWCFAMVCLSTILALVAGSLSFEWRRAETRLRQTAR